MSKKIYVVLLTALTVGLSTQPIEASASDKNPIIGKGNIVSKRVTLTRHHGMPNAHKRRLDAIKAKTRA